ncbi:MAG: 30S ribosomal protein S12 methylthiotransferase RimO [Planctomycetia bacterium]|nr:30S ribosomal protein S12 methylthiotransferase RimO [Planctomycetia bacterium]
MSGSTGHRSARSSSRRSGQVRPFAREVKGSRCCLISLGCPKNLVDSESMLGRLAAAGVEFVPDGTNVDFALLNTCGFLASAREEAENCIKELIRLKKDGQLRFIIVAGCLVRHAGPDLVERFPLVDAWLSPFDELRLPEVVAGLFTGATAALANVSESGRSTGNRFLSSPDKRITFDDSRRTRLTAPHVAYLKIADGCDRFCSYCLIPSIRGRYVSKDLPTIMTEARALAESGVRELVLIAQETNFWGSDLFGQPQLATLLRTLQEENQFDWIRVLYSYPLHFDPELTSLFGMRASGETSILPYIDLPLQHCNDELLKKMNRKVGKSETEELLARLRETIPGLTLRTSMITGFPGETQEMFEELVEFMAKWSFERAGIFKFSAEPGTPAADLPGQISERVKDERYRKLYAKQERRTHLRARTLVGTMIDVMIDQTGTDEAGNPLPDFFVGRTPADSPDIDPVVYVTGTNLVPGRIVPCEVVEVDGLDLVAVPADATAR